MPEQETSTCTTKSKYFTFTSDATNYRNEEEITIRCSFFTMKQEILLLLQLIIRTYLLSNKLYANMTKRGKQ